MSMTKKIQRAEQARNQARDVARSFNLALSVLAKKHGGTLTLTDADLALFTEGMHVRPVPTQDGSIAVRLVEPQPTLAAAFRWRWWRLGWAWCGDLPALGCRRVWGRLWWVKRFETQNAKLISQNHN